MSGIETKLVRVDTSCGSHVGNLHSPSCNVLMSTYNGEKYISDQMNSILSQEGVSVRVAIRDDGSTDGTRDLLFKYRQDNPGAVSVDLGENMGFLKSFEKILLNSRHAEFYAFSDQDDVWGTEKLRRAIGVLEKSGDSPAFYASSVLISDQNLKPLTCNSFPNFTYSIASEFVRHRLAGHTMVWNEALQSKIREVGQLPVWSHDQHVVLIALLVGATCYLDSASWVRHRRLDASITPGGGSPIKRLKHELALINNRGNLMDRRKLAESLLGLEEVFISQNDESFLRMVARYQDSCRSRFELFRSPHLQCGVGAGNVEARVSVALGRF